MPFFKKENNVGDESFEKKPDVESSEKDLEILQGHEIQEDEEIAESQKTEETFKQTPFVVSSPASSILLDKEQAKSETQQSIEKILLEDLEDICLRLPIDKQREIEVKKEEISSKIEIIINEVQIKMKKLFKLIKEWLKLIPGVNKFFLEQETKIKMDEIIELSKKIEKM
ncbi:MAG: hypothetical protein AAB526_03300 [Patescibacteria group bacterium]